MGKGSYWEDKCFLCYSLFLTVQLVNLKLPDKKFAGVSRTLLWMKNDKITQRGIRQWDDKVCPCVTHAFCQFIPPLGCFVTTPGVICIVLKMGNSNRMRAIPRSNNINKWWWSWNVELMEELSLIRKWFLCTEWKETIFFKLSLTKSTFFKLSSLEDSISFTVLNINKSNFNIQLLTIFCKLNLLTSFWTWSKCITLLVWMHKFLITQLGKLFDSFSTKVQQEMCALEIFIIIGNAVGRIAKKIQTEKKELA